MMMTNPVLETKYRTQRQLDEEAGHDLRNYMNNAHQIACEVERQYGFKFKYGSLQGGKREALEGDRPKSA
jgi:hypothetical protein